MNKITFFLMIFCSGVIFAQPDTTPTTPPHASSDVVSAFSESYSSPTLTPNTFGVPGNNSDAEVKTYAGNEVLEITHNGGDFLGFDLSSPLDASQMETFHVDFWVDNPPTGAVLIFKWSNHSGGHQSGETDAFIYTQTTINGGAWNSVDIPLANFNNAAGNGVDSRSILSQLVINVGSASGIYAPVYIDNMYFWRDNFDPNADATLSDLTLDGNTIDGFSAGVLTYNVELLNGTSTPPTVAGVATQAGNGASAVAVTQAPGVPGTATLEVTAPNGTNIETYTVNFTESPALPPAAPTPPSVPAIGIISDVYANVSVPQVDVFGGVLTNLDLNTDGNEEARSLDGGSGFQFNWFAGTFLDISDAAFMHLDFYAEGLADNDVLRIRLVDGDNDVNIARIELTAAQSGSWVSVDLEIPDGVNRNDFGDVDSGADPINTSSLGLIQINTLDLGSSLGSKEIFLSNIYFYGGALSTDDFDTGQFSVSPNPSNTVWNLKGQTQITAVQVFDLLGKEVISVQPNALEVELDTSNLNTGLYLAKIASSTGIKTIKLVKN